MDRTFASILHASHCVLRNFIRGIFGGAVSLGWGDGADRDAIDSSTLRIYEEKIKSLERKVSSLEYIEERLSNIEDAIGLILHQKWEFKYISNTVPHLLNDEIIFASQDGWELVCVVRNGTFSTAYMKRKIK